MNIKNHELETKKILFPGEKKESYFLIIVIYNEGINDVINDVINDGINDGIIEGIK